MKVVQRFCLPKRKCGMGLVAAKLQEMSAHVVDMSVLALNLCKIWRILLHILAVLLDSSIPQGKLAIAQ